MPIFTATSPGKIILFGEHAVVYGQPAIAVPVNQVQARATVKANLARSADGIIIQAPDIGINTRLNELLPMHPLSAAVHAVQNHYGIRTLPPCTIRVTSTIPIASGLGSGAAVTASIIKALSAFIGHPLSAENISALTYEVEKIHHGTPSGIDNTVIAFSKPVYFVRGESIQAFDIETPFTIVIADTGIPSPTRDAVLAVRKAWQSNPDTYNTCFEQIGSIVDDARNAIRKGAIRHVGKLMTENHLLLQKIGVSCRQLDTLVDSAIQAGALGAKLSGGGKGGNMIALTTKNESNQVASYLRKAGAVKTIITTVA